MIDEAGMMSARQMEAIERKAEAVGARLSVGDKGQNSSHSEVLSGPYCEHGATTGSIREIIRRRTQRQAVELIANGNGSAGWSY